MLRSAILFALAVAATFAARDALTGSGPHSVYSGILAIALVAVLIGTILRMRTGINTAAVHCPNCDAVQPLIRKPGSFRQAMWGGYTCAACGTDMDKWGRKAQV